MFPGQQGMGMIMVYNSFALFCLAKYDDVLKSVQMLTSTDHLFFQYTEIQFDTRYEKLWTSDIDEYVLCGVLC